MAVTIENVDMEMNQDQDEVVLVDPVKLAETKKELGNHQYKIKQYAKALAYYTEAIELTPQNASYYGNRSACHLMQGHYHLALSDALQAVTIDPKFVKAWVRIAKCNLALGDVDATENAFAKVKELDEKMTSLTADLKNLETFKKYSDDATKAYAAKDFRKVVFCLDRALEIGVACTRFKVLKAECLCLLGRLQEAQELANDVLSNDKQNADAILVRGMCLYYQDNETRAFEHFQRVLKLAPDHKKAMDIYKRMKALKIKKEAGNEAFKSGRNDEAYALYTEALSIDPNHSQTNAKLYFNRATVSTKLGKLEQAIQDCTMAMNLDPTYLKPILRRAKCYMDLQQYEDAVADYKKAFNIEKTREIKNLLHEAELELKKSQRKDYYKILGIDKNASTEDIKKAYRKRALVYHPDRHANASENEKKEQEKKFKEVGEAYGILSDPQKRMKYDSGQDLDDSRVSGAEVFQTFFSEGGGFPERVFQTFFTGSPHDFPGGTFTFQTP